MTFCRNFQVHSPGQAAPISILAEGEGLGLLGSQNRFAEIQAGPWRLPGDSFVILEIYGNFWEWIGLAAIVKEWKRCLGRFRNMCDLRD